MWMKDAGRKFVFLYERFAWYVGLFTGEIDKPLTIFKYVSYAGILVKVFGATITLWQLIGFGILATIAAFVGGFVLVKSGVIAYVTELNNSQNPTLQEIRKLTSNKKMATITKDDQPDPFAPPND